MSNKKDPFEDFIRKLQESRDLDEVDIFLNSISPNVRHLVEICAIPSFVDKQIFKLLVDKFGDESSKEISYETLSNFAVIREFGSQLKYHDNVRDHILHKWITKDEQKLDRFKQISAFLKNHFAERLTIYQSNHGFLNESIFNEYVFHLAGFNLETGLRIFGKSINRQRLDYNFGMAELLIQMMKVYLPLLSDEQRIWIRYQEAKLLIDQGYLDKASKKLDKILKDARKIKVSTELEAKILFRIGLIRTKNKKFKVARNVYSEALNRIRNGSNQPASKIEYQIMVNLAGVDTELDNLTNSIEILLSVEQKAKRMHWPEILLYTYNALGNLYMSTSEFKKATTYYEKSLKNLSKFMSTDNYLASQIYLRLGSCFFLLGSEKKSIDYLEKNLSIKSRVGDEVGIAQGKLELARVYLEKNIVRSIDLTKQCEQEVFNIPDSEQKGYIYTGIGDLYSQFKLTYEAQDFYLRALELFKKLDKKKNIEHVNNILNRRFRKSNGLPWYVWIAIVIAVLIVLHFSNSIFEIL